MIIKSTEDIVLSLYGEDYHLCQYKDARLIYFELFNDVILAVQAFELRIKKRKGEQCQ